MARNDWVQLVNSDTRGISSDGLTLASFTTSAPVFPTIALPANFLRAGRNMHLRASGIWAATATPTYTFRLQNTVGTAVTLVTSAAVTVSALTNQSWWLDIMVQCRTEGTAGTLEAHGILHTLGVTVITRSLPDTGTAPATATVDTTIAQTWGLEIACSASSASNTVKGVALQLLSIN